MTPQNPILKAHLEGVEKIQLLVKEYSNADYLYSEENYPKEDVDKAMKNILSFLTTYTESILNAALEAGPGEVSDYAVNKEIKEKNLRKTEEQWAARAKAHGHNDCLSSFRQAIDEGIKLIK